MTESKNSPLLFVIISILLFFSGLASLIYEVIWTRVLHYTFGSTELAAATVLATFMGGLALGGALGGKFAAKFKKPLLVYGILEGVIAIFGILFTPLLFKLDFIYSLTGPDASIWLLTTLRFLAGVIIMLIPTVAMGATLPVLVHGFVDLKKAGKGIGILYFINTIGAVTGTLLAGFSLIPRFGLDKSVIFAAAIGLLVTIISIFIQYKLKPKALGLQKSKDDDKESDRFRKRFTPIVQRYSFWGALVFAFMAGFISLSNEILWFKLLSILLDGTIYGFSALLAAFLAGLAIGSIWISGKIEKSNDLWGFYVKLQIGAAIGSIITLLLIPIIPFLISGYIAGGAKTPGSVFLAKIVMVFFTILIPTFFYGASFPILARLAGMNKSMSRAVGNIYSINTLGCIIGSTLMGMVLLPILKNINLLLLSMVFLTIIVAFSAAFFAGGTDSNKSINRKIRLFSYIAITLFAVILINPNVNVIKIVNSRYSVEDYGNSIGARVKSLFGSTKDKKNLVFEAEGTVTVVTVHKHSDGGFRLRNNGLNESYHAITQPYYAEEIFFLGALPWFLHPHAEKALLIGLGGGGTLDILSQTGMKKIEVAELEPEVVNASRLMFGKRKHPLDRKNVRLRVDDGRNALLRHAHTKPHTYDIIVSQPSHPWLSGAANLYTVEHFKIVKKNLRKNGMLCQWVNLFRMNEEGYRSLMGAFTSAFDNGYVFQVDDNSVFMVGVNGDLKISPETIKKNLKNKNFVELAKYYNLDLNRILKMYFYDFETAKIMAEGAKVNSDHTPIIETVLPWVGHNTMFNVEKYLQKSKLIYGLNPKFLSKGTNSRKTGIEFLNYLIDEINIDDLEVSDIKYKIKFFHEVMKNWKTRLGDEYYRIESKFYSQLNDYDNSLQSINKVKRFNNTDLNNLSEIYKKEYDYKNLAILNGLRFLKNENLFNLLFGQLLENLPLSSYETRLSDVSYKSESTISLAKALSRYPFMSWSVNYLSLMLSRDPNLNNKKDIDTWYFISKLNISSKNPNTALLTKYVDLGGDNPKLLKKMLFYFAKKNNKDMVDQLVSVLQNWSSSDAENFGHAKRLMEFGVNRQALRIFKSIYESPEMGIESKDVLKEILKLMKKLKLNNGLGGYFKEFNKLIYDESDKKFKTKFLKKFSESNRKLLAKGVDPI